MPIMLVLCLSLGLAGVLLAIFLRERRQQKRLRLRVQKLYASRLFEELLPLLKVAKKRRLEQVTVDKTGLVLRHLFSEGGETAFLMRPHGYRYLTPEQQEAMRVMLEECLPKLHDSSLYHLSRRRIRLLNGDIEYSYRYTITNAYKASLARAPYYDGSMQARSW